MNASIAFARRVFFWAGVYGVIVLAPQYLIELGIGPELAAPIARPEHFYGFIGVALAWQFIFLVISHDVQRYRLMMLPAILEKLAFGIPALLLFIIGRVGSDVLVFASQSLGSRLVLCMPVLRRYRRHELEGHQLALPRQTHRPRQEMEKFHVEKRITELTPITLITVEGFSPTRLLHLSTVSSSHTDRKCLTSLAPFPVLINFSL